MAEAKKTIKKATAKPAAVKKVKAPEKADKKVEDVKEELIEQAAETPAKQPATDKATAKAGKRSAKAVKEQEELKAKEERKAETDDKSEVKPKKVEKPAKSRLERRSKGYRKVAKLIDKDNTYTLEQALDLAIKTSPVRFDATVEVHLRLAVDPKQADQNIRDTVVLPAGTGRAVRVAVFADPEAVAAATKAGADIAAADEFLQQLDKEQTDFDVLISTPTMMAKLGKYARLLGPKGLMPNPKSGTVTTDVAKAVKEAKAGKVEYRVDSAGIIHVGVGKVSFGGDKLAENAKAVISSIRANKPSSVKGTFVNSAYATTTMGPSIKLDLSDIAKL